MNTEANKLFEPSFDPTLTEGLIALIRNKPVTQDDMDIMALFTLDGIANMLAGRRSSPGEKLMAYLQGREGDAGRRALVMGGLTHILEVDDLHKASVVHPACVTIPAAIALSQDQPTSGIEFLRAILFGFEACTRVGMAVGKEHYKVWHNTATCGTFGGAMTAATLLALSDEECMYALGNAGTQSAGLWEFLNTGAMSKHLHAGRAAEAGIVSAQLAKLGFTGPPSVLEGPQGFFAGACPDPDPDAVLRDPDAPWQVHSTSIKPWPSCRHTHPVIDAALELSGKIKVKDIDYVDVIGYQAAIDVCNRPNPETEYEAKFSLQHCVAVSLLDGENVFASYNSSARDRADGLRSRIKVSAGEGYSAAYPENWGGEVTVHLRDGGEITATRNACKGDPELPLDREQMILKARELLAFASVNDANAVVDGVLDMAHGGDVPDLKL